MEKQNLILILNLNNPSGTVCNTSRLANVAKKYKILILSDEIYTDLTFSNDYNSISKYYPEFLFITGGLSNGGAGGWRLSFYCANKLTEFLKSLKSLLAVLLNGILQRNMLLWKLMPATTESISSK